MQGGKREVEEILHGSADAVQIALGGCGEVGAQPGIDANRGVLPKVRRKHVRTALNQVV